MLSVLTVLSMLALEASAFWRLPCRQSLTVERIDPLTQFGKVGEHVHTIHGGNRFAANAAEADLLQSTCTSCAVKQDMSAYWTPAMYFEDDAGKFHIVNQTGGMLVYYLPRGENVKAFPPGFRMIAGDPGLRDFPYPEVEKSHWQNSDRTESALRQKAVGFNCLNYRAPANAALGLKKMPENMANNCVDGLRTEVFFPSCWNGKDLDSKNHRDHMRYPSLMDDGYCPPGFETRLVSLFFETIWNVNAFAGEDGRFVFSTGDPLGYGYHGDFMNAWDVPVLQQAIDQCTSLTGRVEECPVFDLQNDVEMMQCTIPRTVDEDVHGPLVDLPGCNFIEWGPDRATEGGCSGDENLTTNAPEPVTSTRTFSKESSTSSVEVPTTTAAAPPPDYSTPAYGDLYDENGFPIDWITNDEPAAPPAKADPNVVVVTVTRYTTVAGTTVTVHAAPTPYAKRHHGLHRRGHTN